MTAQYQLFPELTADEYTALKASISEIGVRVPVELDEDGNILDGHHRVRAWTELRAEGVNVAGYPRIIRTGMTEQQKRNYVRVLNLARRHLDKEQRNDAMREMRADGMTYQAIADAAGVDVATAWRETHDVELLQMQKLPGVDGKFRPPAYQRRGTDTDGELIHGYAGNYRKKGDLKRCEVCGMLWMAELPYCPYCHVSPEARAAHLQQQESHAPQPHVSYNSGNNEWYTPAQYITAARAVMGDIDLDPASSNAANAVVCANTFYTAEDDGLSKNWYGSVWMNPPYASELIGRFCTKLANHVSDGDVSQAVVLVNNATETTWFNTLISVASAVCFPRGRVRFWSPDRDSATPLQGQAIIYIGPNTERFRTEFASIGWSAVL